MKQAVEEIKGIISSQYPATIFSVNPDVDPDGIHLTAKVDMDDVDDVYGLISTALASSK